jgi:hypothetical protein
MDVSVSAAWIRFAQPWWLLAALAALLPGVMAAAARRRGRHVRAPSVILQTFATLCAAAALAQPAARLGAGAARPVLVFRDVSGSMRRQREAALPLPHDLPGELYHFADGLFREGGSAAEGRTLIAPVLQLAAARARQIAGVVIDTDGRFDDAGWAPIAAAIAEANLNVVIVARNSPPADVRIADFRAERRADGRAELRVTVASNARTTRGVSVRADDAPEAPLLRRTLHMLAGDSATFRLTHDGPRDRAAVYRAELTGGDALPENDSAAALVLPAGRRVAVLTDVADFPAAAIADAAGIPTELRAPAEAPEAAEGWMDYAAVLATLPGGRALTAPQRAALAEYVQSGGGLVLVGAGPHGSPADRHDPLNRVLALLANPYQRRPLKVTVLLDASGSMAAQAEDDEAAGRIRFEVACDAVLSLRRHLTRQDRLRVVTFSDEPRTVYDGGDAPADFAAVRDALDAVRPTGPTILFPALAAEAAPASAGRKGLLLVVSDLQTKPFDAAEAARLVTRAGLSLAIVATGGGEVPAPGATSIEQLCAVAGAPLVRKSRLTGLAEVFARFLRDARGEAIRRGRFTPSARAAPFGLDSLRLADLDAYIPAAARSRAEVLADVGPDPLLARWQAGLGRNVCLAAPLGGGSNAALLRSSELTRLLAAAVTWTARPAGDPRFAGVARRDGPRLHIRVDARDGDGPMNGLSLSARVRAAPATAEPVRSVALRQVAPGRYEGGVATGSGPVGLVVYSGARAVWQAGLGAAAPPEYAAIGADWPGLRRLAEHTGGRIVSPARAAEALTAMGRSWRAGAFVALWPWILAAAVAAMLIEWTGTRVWRRG